MGAGESTLQADRIYTRVTGAEKQLIAAAAEAFADFEAQLEKPAVANAGLIELLGRKAPWQ